MDEWLVDVRKVNLRALVGIGFEELYMVSPISIEEIGEESGFSVMNNGFDTRECGTSCGSSWVISHYVADGRQAKQ